VLADGWSLTRASRWHCGRRPPGDRPPPANRIKVDYQVLAAVTDPRRALDEDAPKVHEDGNLVRHPEAT